MGFPSMHIIIEIVILIVIIIYFSNTIKKHKIIIEDQSSKIDELEERIEQMENIVFGVNKVNKKPTEEEFTPEKIRDKRLNSVTFNNVQLEKVIRKPNYDNFIENVIKNDINTIKEENKDE
jgi:hypothetical protein